MKLHELKYNDGAVKNANRVGRGTSSGNGKTSGRGQKGQNSPSGGGVRLGFEGGQNPLFRKVPKRGFNNYNFEVKYSVINVSDLNKFEDGATVNAAALKEAGIIKKELDGVKVLGNGAIEKKLTVQAAKFSKSAVAAIEAAGGKTEVI